MIKIYNTDHKFLALLDKSFKDVFITETLDTGLKDLTFKVPCQDKYLELIEEENYVETSDASFIIKEIINEDNNFIEVFCGANVETLQGTIFVNFDCFELSLKQAYEYCIAGTGWTVDYKSANKSIITYQLPYRTAYEMIRQIQKDYNHEILFDTKNKILKVYDTMGSANGAYFSNELKLKKLAKQSSSYDYATVILPIGKDGLRITDVNNGSPYLKHFGYSNKNIERLYINEDADRAEILLKLATDYLAEVCVPRASYKIKLTDLNKDIHLGDTIMIVDKIKHIKQKQRIVKITKYPFAPEKDMVELSNLQVDFVLNYNEDQKELKHNQRVIREDLGNFKKYEATEHQKHVHQENYLMDHIERIQQYVNIPKDYAPVPENPFIRP